MYPQALGTLFVASYDLQGYIGGVRTRLHTAFISKLDRQPPATLKPFCTDRIENTVSNKVCVPIRCLETVCITPFYCCMLVCCGCYLATAAVYGVTP
jgi:hypothetical protein